jgi:hypothetical protein
MPATSDNSSTLAKLKELSEALPEAMCPPHNSSHFPIRIA